MVCSICMRRRRRETKDRLRSTERPCFKLFFIDQFDFTVYRSTQKYSCWACLFISCCQKILALVFLDLPSLQTEQQLIGPHTVWATRWWSKSVVIPRHRHSESYSYIRWGIRHKRSLVTVCRPVCTQLPFQLGVWYFHPAVETQKLVRYEKLRSYSLYISKENSQSSAVHPAVLSGADSTTVQCRCNPSIVIVNAWEFGPQHTQDHVCWWTGLLAARLTTGDRNPFDDVITIVCVFISAPRPILTVSANGENYAIGLSDTCSELLS